MKLQNTTVARAVQTDVLVAGGGIAGCAAALAAARGGTNVTLLESGGCLGGQAGFGLVTPLSAHRTRDGRSFGGIIEELAQESATLSDRYCTANREGESFHGPASPHILKYLLLKKLVDANVNIRFHTIITSAETNGARVKSVCAFDKSGFCTFTANTFIDATGDADLIALTGAEFVLGSEANVFSAFDGTDLAKRHFSDETYDAYDSGHMQPVSIFFIMGGVDYEKAAALNNKRLCFGDLGITRERFEAWPFANTCGFEIADDRIPMPQGRVLVSPGTRPDMAVINMSRVIGIDGSNADSLNDGEIRAQLQLVAIVDFLQTFIPGFEHSYYIQSACSLGVRESRRLVGRHILTGVEAIHCIPQPDVIARGSYIIDIHDPRGKRGAIGGPVQGAFYDIPYGCLLAREYDNLLACGRCISVDHVAHSSTRIQGTCALTGQAAGTAAAMALYQGCAPCDLEVSALQQQLRIDGVFLD